MAEAVVVPEYTLLAHARATGREGRLPDRARLGGIVNLSQPNWPM